jgi:hypothetical protein
MLAGDRIDLAGLDHLLPRLPLEAYEPLLEALGTSPSRAVRRRLLELLSRTTVNISSLIIPRLDDTHWYVQRNMLMLLTRSGHVPEGFSVLRWTTHPDARVRSEAVRLQLTLPQERDAGVRMAITDSDPRIVHIGLTAIRDECPVHLVDHVIDLALTPESGEDIRLLSVKVLSRLRHESVLDALLRLADGGRSFFGRQRLPPKTPVLVAVIRLLSSTWSDDPRTRAVLKAAARSSDRELREAGSLTT